MTSAGGRSVVVVGGASGSGRATATAFAEDGDHVTIADLDLDLASEVARDLAARGASAAAVRVDISDEASVRALADHLRTGGRPIDVLYNSAALTDPDHQRRDQAPATVPLATWNRTLDVDLTGVMLTCRELLPLLRAPGGVIVNVTSNAGLRGNDTLVSYGVAKAGLHQLTRTIATAYGHLGIRCNALSPASIVSESFLTNVPPEAIEAMRSVCLLPQLGAVHDIAALARYLCSPEASYITGETVRVDGGALGHLPGAVPAPRKAVGSSGASPPAGAPTWVLGSGALADTIARRLGRAAPTTTLAWDAPLPKGAPLTACLVVPPEIEELDLRVAAATITELADRLAAAGGGSLLAAVSTPGSASAAAGAVSAALSSLVLRTAQEHGRAGVRADVVEFDAAIAAGRRPPGALLPRDGSPEDIAAAISHLASPDARFTTGIVLHLDGGRSARLPHTVASSHRPPLTPEFSA